MDIYFPASAQHAKAREFLELKQGMMTMLEYMAKFTNMAKVRKFENGLKLSIQ